LAGMSIKRRIFFGDFFFAHSSQLQERKNWISYFKTTTPL
jgi:hypothetical protein